MGQKYFDEEGNEVQVHTVTKKRKRGGCFKWGCLILIVLVVIGACAAALGGGDSSSSDTQTSEESTSEEATVVGIGEEAQAGSMSVTVNEVTNQEVVSNSYTQETPSTGNYLLADVTITNNGNEAVTLDTTNFKLELGDTTYDADSMATTTINEDSTSFFLNSLNPEATLNGTVAFDISEESANDSELTMAVSAGFLSMEESAIIALNQ